MKQLKVHKDLLFVVNPLIVLGGFFLFWHHLRLILLTFHVLWIPAIIAALIIITPLGNKYLCLNHDEVAKRIPFLQWISRIVILELSLIGTYAGIAKICGDFFPVMTSEHPALFINSLKHSIGIGLFPWPMFALVAATMSIVAYRKQKNAFMSTLFNPFKEHDPHEKISILINIGTRRCTILATSITIMFMTMIILSFLSLINQHLTYGFQPTALFTTLIILIFSTSNTVKNFLGRFFVRKLSLPWGLITFCLLFAFSILAVNTIILGMVREATHQVAKTPLLIQMLTEKDWYTCWLIFSGIWALSLVPAISVYLADISKGYRLRDLLLGTLALPVIILLGILFIQHQDITLPNLPTNLTKTITLISCWLFLSLILKHQTLPNVIVSYFPKDGLIKQRDFKPFFRDIVSLTIGAFFIFFVLGINGLSIFSFAINYIYIIFFLAAAITLLKHLLSKEKTS